MTVDPPGHIPSSRDALEPLRALVHPLWMGALAVLLLNDYVLKAQLDAPVVTGKLSDVAGLIVAPVLLAVLLRVRSDRGLVGCGLLTASVFAAINLSPTLAGLWDATLGIGLGSAHTWVDPTDLLALPAAALGLRAMYDRMRTPLARPGRYLAFAFVCVGAFACLGSFNWERPDTGPPQFDARVALLNKTHEMHVFRISRLNLSNTDVDCEKISEEPREYLSPAVFDDRVRLQVFSAEQVGLGGENIRDWERQRNAGAPCRAVRIAVQGADTIIAFWSTDDLERKTFRVDPEGSKQELGGSQTIAFTGDYSNVDSSDMKPFGFRPCGDNARGFCDAGQEAAQIPDGVSYAWAERNRGALFWEEIGRNARERRDPAERCERPLRHPGLEWTSFPNRRLRVVDVTKRPDGCHYVRTAEPGTFRTTSSHDTGSGGDAGRSDDAGDTSDVDGADTGVPDTRTADTEVADTTPSDVGTDATSDTGPPPDSVGTRRTVCAPWEFVERFKPQPSAGKTTIRPADRNRSNIDQVKQRVGIEFEVRRGGDRLGSIALFRGAAASPVPSDIDYRVPLNCKPRVRECGRVDLPARLLLSVDGSRQSVGVLRDVTIGPSTSIQFVRALYRPVARVQDACKGSNAPQVSRMLQSTTGLYTEAIVTRGFDRSNSR